MSIRPRYSGRNRTHKLCHALENGGFSDWVTISSPFSTPWGRAQTIVMYRRGVRLVSTSSSGGYMISEGFAEKHLSNNARRIAIKYGKYYCFEDNLYVIINHELRETVQGKKYTEEELANVLGSDGYKSYRYSGKDVVTVPLLICNID